MKRMLQMEQPQKAMIFCNTREQVDKIFDIMRKWKMSVTAIHGGLEQHVRTNRMRAFKKRRVQNFNRYRHGIPWSSYPWVNPRY